MIWYLPAKVVPLIKDLTGVCMVLVREIAASSDKGNLDPHFPQNTVFSGFSY
jgi:hypothetical protein